MQLFLLMASQDNNTSTCISRVVHEFPSATSAAVAIGPALPFIVEKTKLQQGISSGFSSSGILSSIKLWPETAPVVFITIGWQNMVASALEAYISSIYAAVGAGFLSAPLYVVFNGQGMGLSPIQSLKGMTLTQGLSITARETMFVYSLRISKPVSQHIKSAYENVYLSILSHFMVGAFGSAAGHLGDCCLTYNQMGSSFAEQWAKYGLRRACTRGLGTKAAGIGIFNIGFQETRNFLERLKRSY